MDLKKEHYYWIVVLVAIIAGFLIIKPYISAILLAAILAYLLYPAHLKLKAKIPQTISAGILTICILIIAIFFIRYGVQFLLTEFARAYTYVSKAGFEAFFPETISPGLKDLIRQILSKLMVWSGNIIYKIPRLLVSSAIFFMSFFYFIRDGGQLYTKLKAIVPLSAKKKEQFFGEFKRYTRAFVRVLVLIGIAQGFIAALGFYLFKLPYPLLAGLAAAILSILPIVGPYILYVPVGVLWALKGNVLAGVGILIYGLAIASVLDYVLRPYLTGKAATIHPLIVLVGIFGGLALLGPAGIIIGPVALSIVAILLKESSLVLKVRT